jgi:hypothetical protein
MTLPTWGPQAAPPARQAAGRFFSFLDLTFFLNGVFVRFSTRGVQKHHRPFLEKVMSKTFAQKNEKKVCVVFFLRSSIFFYHVFGRFSA